MLHAHLQYLHNNSYCANFGEIVSLMVWEELITLYMKTFARPIAPAHLPTRHSPIYKSDELCATQPKMCFIYQSYSCPMEIFFDKAFNQIIPI
jgi:hypothetical protein